MAKEEIVEVEIVENEIFHKEMFEEPQPPQLEPEAEKEVPRPLNSQTI